MATRRSRGWALAAVLISSSTGNERLRPFEDPPRNTTQEETTLSILDEAGERCSETLRSNPWLDRFCHACRLQLPLQASTQRRRETVGNSGHGLNLKKPVKVKKSRWTRHAAPNISSSDCLGLRSRFEHCRDCHCQVFPAHKGRFVPNRRQTSSRCDRWADGPKLRERERALVAFA